MKRLAIVIALVATSLAADEQTYRDGVAAVQSKDYATAVSLLQRAITEAPVESAGYLPHYWIGIAKYELGDVDGALRHWRISSDQGAIKKTAQSSDIRSRMARAQAARQGNAQADPDAPKKNAEAAIRRALAKQGEAIGRGRDRSADYQTGKRKLAEANAVFGKGGYPEAIKLANEAHNLFAGGSFTVPFDDEPKKPQKRPEPTDDDPQIDSAARADASVAVQSYRRRILNLPRGAAAAAETREWDRLRKELDRATSDAAYESIAERARASEKKLAERRAVPEVSVEPQVPEPAARKKMPQPLEKAYRAYATGDLAASEAQLTSLIGKTPTAEAFLLRGCARYTRALLTRSNTDAAAADFREALVRDRTLRLDQSAFSPKIVQFFDQLRAARR